jgi:hypothetical protein
LWRYRELSYFLAWGDILIRYKQTVVGVAWAVIWPLLTMIILTVVFGGLANLPSGGAGFEARIEPRLADSCPHAVASVRDSDRELLRDVLAPRFPPPLSPLEKLRGVASQPAPKAVKRLYRMMARRGDGHRAVRGTEVHGRSSSEASGSHARSV